MGIIIKSSEELKIMREAGRIVAQVLSILAEETKPGITTASLEALADQEIRKRGAIPSFKGYRGFPASICTSVNKEVVHGIPRKRRLKEGDIISFDVGAIYKGFHGDAARTIGVGKINSKAEKLIRVTQGALLEGISKARQRAYLGDISAAIQFYTESRGFSVVREYVGHGIGREMHEEPQVPNFGHPKTGLLLRKGMTLALEPMATENDWRTKVSQDGWTVITLDGGLAAHFEDTIAITEGEAEVLTEL